MSCIQPRWEGPEGFRSWEASGQVKKKLKLLVVNLKCDVIFIMFKASTQWGLIGSLVVPLCKVNPFPLQSKISNTGNAVEVYEYNVSN